MKVLRDGTVVVVQDGYLFWTTPDGEKNIGLILKEEAGIAIIQTNKGVLTLNLEEV